MPLICSLANPYNADVLDSCWAFCSRLELDFDDKVGSVSYSVYADKASAYSGKPPLQVFTFGITNVPGESQLPVFDDLVADNSTAYGLLLTALDALMLQQPQFAGGSVDRS